jgi:hypothetical protein
MDTYCLMCIEEKRSYNQKVENPPAGLCCDGCNAITVSTCDKLGGIFGGMKGWTNCNQCGHTGAGHYQHGNQGSKKDAEKQLKEVSKGTKIRS